MEDVSDTQNEAPPLPEVWPFPSELLDRWVALPEDAPLGFTVTRRMLDNLFFAIANLQLAQADFDVALVAYSNGDLDTANSRLIEGRQRNIYATNHSRQMLAGFMATATVLGE